MKVGFTFGWSEDDWIRSIHSHPVPSQLPTMAGTFNERLHSSISQSPCISAQHRTNRLEDALAMPTEAPEDEIRKARADREKTRGELVRIV